MSSNSIGGDRPLRVCDLCGGVDDHPRHILNGNGPYPQPGQDIVDRVLENAPAEKRSFLVGELLDTKASDRHMDCCRAAGCPEGLCGPQTAGAEELRGGALLAHLEMLGGKQ